MIHSIHFHKAVTNKTAHLPILSFKSAEACGAWLEKHHADSRGIWLRFFKKNSGVATVTHAEALDEALCYGWIDGQLQKYDDKSGLQKFTPRQSKSIWSKKNIEHTARLLKANKIKARAFFKTLNRANTYAIAWRLATAKKPETRERRLKAIFEMLAKAEKFHP